MDPLTIMALVTGVLKAGQELYAFIAAERERLRQSGEWTVGQEQAFQDLEAQRSKQAWQQPTGPRMD